MRHIGHKKLVLSVIALKHGKQSSWLHGILTGSISISKQMGHEQSFRLRFRSALAVCKSFLFLIGLMVAAIVSELLVDDELLGLEDTCRLAMRLSEVDIFI
jgi:hypothetical protein